jgi:hypothetical protein
MSRRGWAIFGRTKASLSTSDTHDCKVALREVKGMILEQLAETDEEKAEYERYWPFD